MSAPPRPPSAKDIGLRCVTKRVFFLLCFSQSGDVTLCCCGGCSFIQSYFNCLSKAPSNLHHFYNEESSFTHGTGTEVRLLPNTRLTVSLNTDIESVDVRAARGQTEYQ